MSRSRSIPASSWPGSGACCGGSGRHSCQARLADRASVRFGRYLLDLDARRLFALDGSEVPITAMEFDLLEAFASNPNRVLSRDRLLELAHKGGNDPFDRSIDIRVARLRQKIEPHPDKPQTIKTVRGAGYVFVPVATQPSEDEG